MVPSGPTERSVCIVGPHRMQNDLMASFLNDEVGVPTRVFSDPSHLSTRKGGVFGAALVLADAPYDQRDRLLDALPDNTRGLLPSQTFALFNVSPGLSIELDAFFLGVKGFLYRDDSPEILARGVRGLLDGEVWMSRRAMAACLLNRPTPPSHRSDHPALLHLTARETEVLRHIRRGGSNEDIADRLFISLNTIKTHIYHIFRKIEVDNRLQAALWAAENL